MTGLDVLMVLAEERMLSALQHLPVWVMITVHLASTGLPASASNPRMSVMLMTSCKWKHQRPEVPVLKQHFHETP